MMFFGSLALTILRLPSKYIDGVLGIGIGILLLGFLLCIPAAFVGMIYAYFTGTLDERLPLLIDAVMRRR